MRHRRSSFAISTLILEMIADEDQAGVSKTKLMQYLLLNNSCLDRYCNLLESKGLIYRDSQNRWYITKKGLLVLANCYQMVDFLKKPVKNLVDKYSIKVDNDDTISYLPHM
jgi:predicted transcriptional regulator